MDSRVLEIRTTTLELPRYDWEDESRNPPRHYIPIARFSDIITRVRITKEMLYDYQLDVIKHQFVEYGAVRRKKLYTTQKELLTHVLAHYLDVGPNGKPFDDTPWMDDPLPVLLPYRDGWRVIDGHHRIIVSRLLNRNVYCAIAEPKPQYSTKETK